MRRIRESQPLVRRPRRLATAVATAALAAAGAVLVPVGPGVAPAHAAGPSSFTLTGAGFGHGRGLSQYGAQNAARNLGRTANQILDFYYPGTTSTRVSDILAVLLTKDTDNDLIVGPRSGLRLRSLKTNRLYTLNRANAVRWRVVPLGTTSTRLQVILKGRSGWVTLGTVPGQTEFLATGPIRLYLPGGSTATYRGRLRSTLTPEGRRTVNIVGLEDYLRGVVPAEVPALWHPQAVRAQAVAARTYAVYERRNYTGSRPYQLCDTSLCQVYRGVDAEHPASDQAVAATKGVVRVSAGRVIFSQFSASNGGWSAAGAQPYLVSRRDPWDLWSGNPYRAWSVSLPAATVEAAYPAIGDLLDIRVVNDAAQGGRATSVVLDGSVTDTTVSADRFRSVFGLRSTMFRRG